MFERTTKLSKTHSFFLFGPRSTGKTTLLRSWAADKKAFWLDLLDPNLEDRLYNDPSELVRLLKTHSDKEWVVIDEVQKVPDLLDVVHQQMNEKKHKFVLTGSSARKLRRGSANLLAGRAFKYACHPLTHQEIADQFDLKTVMRFGSLPGIFSLSERDKMDYLRAYVDNYFKEEIVAEQLVRKLRPFRGFLSVAGQSNGQIININSIAKGVGVDHLTVQTYFEILEDTMVGFFLDPFHESIRKRQTTQSKFYFFDLGVQRALTRSLEVDLVPSTYDYGRTFEHFFILEVRRLIDYFNPDWRLSYLRTKDDVEIDLIIERPGKTRIALEIKSTNRIDTAKNREGFRKLTAEIPNCEAYVVSLDPYPQDHNQIKYRAWEDAIKEWGLLQK